MKQLSENARTAVTPIRAPKKPGWAKDYSDEQPEVVLTVLLPGCVETQWCVTDETRVIADALYHGLRIGVDEHGFWVRNWPSHEDTFPTIADAAEAYITALPKDADY